jgi:hypothetical protein
MDGSGEGRRDGSESKPETAQTRCTPFQPLRVRALGAQLGHVAQTLRGLRHQTSSLVVLHIWKLVQ